MTPEEQRRLEDLLNAAGRSAQPTQPGWQQLPDRLAARPQPPPRRRRLWLWAVPATIAAGVVLFLLFGPGRQPEAQAGPVEVKPLDVEVTILSIAEFDSSTLYMPLMQRLSTAFLNAGGGPYFNLPAQQPPFTGQAMVKDHRLILNLQKGDNVVRFTDVAASIDPTSVRFSSTTDPDGTQVVEQNFEYDLATADSLLGRYIDREIVCIGKDGSEVTGYLASHDPANLVLASGPPDPKKKREVQTVARSTLRAIRLNEVPAGLLTRPTLVWKLRAKTPGKHDTTVSYLCGFIKWQANYVALVTPGGDGKPDTLDLTGWVTIDNTSGATYDQARLKLIAGDVNRMRDPWAMPPPFPGTDGVLTVDGMGLRPDFDAPEREIQKKEFVEKSFFEYHLYALGAPSTVRDRQVKQLNLLQKKGVKADRRYVFDPVVNTQRLIIELVAKNEKENNLGMPLPRGSVRLEQHDADGETGLLGQVSIDHTPAKEEITLAYGQAFDVAGEFREVEPNRFDLTVRNHKTESIAVRAIAHVSPILAIKQSTHGFTQHDFQTYYFDFTLKPNAQEKITYAIGER